MNTRKDRNRLSLIITLWLLVFLLSGMLVVIDYLPKQVERMIGDQIARRAMALSEQLARNAVDGLVSDDPDEKRVILKNVLEALRSERQEFRSAVITDENLIIWGSLNQGDIGKKFVSPAEPPQKGLDEEGSYRPSAAARSSIYDLAVPVILKTRRIGVVFGEVSLAQAAEDGTRVANWILVGAAILFLIGVAGTMTIVATFPLSKAPQAPEGSASATGAVMDPELIQEVETKKEEAAKLTEKIESLKDEELDLIRRLELHQREAKRVEEGAVQAPELLKEDAELAERLAASRLEEQQLLARIETLKQTASDLAEAPLPEPLKTREDEFLKRIEVHKQAEAELLNRLERLKEEEAGRNEEKRREGAALAAKIEEIRKKVLDLDRRIESRRREEMDLAQRIEKRKQEAKELEAGMGGAGGTGT